MSKSSRSKVKKRFRTAKRQRVNAVVEGPRTARKHASLQAVISGEAGAGNRYKAPVKNAFLYPNDKTAKFPQASVKKPIDFRGSHNLTVRTDCLMSISMY